uniref:Homeobox protein Hox-A9a-like n=1 Tax=Sinocyclocheilus rhinocerous TaxID=307959 RepID=A0A673FUG5_9TELE
MSTSGALTGYYVDSLVMPDNEENRFPSGSGLIQHRPSVLPTDHTELGPCTFSAKQPVYGGSGWGHIPTHYSSGVPSVYQPHTQPPVVGDYVQSWFLDSACGLPLSEVPTIHHYLAKPDTNRTNDNVSGRTADKGDDIEEKPGADPDIWSCVKIVLYSLLISKPSFPSLYLSPDNPVSNWLHASSTRKKRCPYTKH